MINFFRRITAFQKVLRHNTFRIGIQGACRQHADGNRLLLEKDTKFIISSSVILSIANFTNMSLGLEFFIVGGTSPSSMTKLPVITLF